MLVWGGRLARQHCNHPNSASVALFRVKQFSRSSPISETQFSTLHHFLRIDRSFFCAYIDIHYERNSSRLVSRSRKFATELMACSGSEISGLKPDA